MGNEPTIKAKSKADKLLREVGHSRLWDASPRAIAVVESILDNPSERTADRLKAADMILSRTIPVIAATKVGHYHFGVGSVDGEGAPIESPESNGLDQLFAAAKRILATHGKGGPESNGSGALH